jgi:hypothetical protein
LQGNCSLLVIQLSQSLISRSTWALFCATLNKLISDASWLLVKVAVIF